MAIALGKITLVLPMELTVTMEARADSPWASIPRPKGYILRASLNLSGRQKLTAEYHAIRDEFLDHPDTTIEQLMVTLFISLSEQVVGPRLKDEHTDAVRQGLMT